jgi:hypothetical protein
MPARGLSKNVALTLWLIAPLATVALLCWWIFHSLAAGPAMQAERRGQGSGDTGGANAFGELLAGNDPDERQRLNRMLREGDLVHPANWPGGVTLLVADPGLPPGTLPDVSCIVFDTPDTSRGAVRTMRREGNTFTITVSAGGLSAATPIYVGTRGFQNRKEDGAFTAFDRDGNAYAPIMLKPIDPMDTPRDEPLVIDLADLGFTLPTD